GISFTEKELRVSKSKEERLLEKAADSIMRSEMKEKVEERRDDFATMIHGYKIPRVAKLGDIIEAKVVQADKEGILVDVGTKSEGFIPWGEFDPRRKKAPPIGEIMQVYVSGKDETGRLLLSEKEADFRLNWAKFEEAFRDGKPIVVKVVKIVKGGVLANLGSLKAFIPASHVSLTRTDNLKGFVGKNLAVRVIQLEKGSRNIVLSRKFLLLEEREKRKEKTLSGLKEGKTVTGRVNSITKFGIFVDLGGIDGLIHPENLSWGWVKDPHGVVSVGDKIKVKVLKMDKEKRKISLGLKQTKPDPWTQVQKKYQVGEQVVGKVTHLTNFGAFVGIEEGLEGLIHVSDLSWEKRVGHPKEVLRKDEKIEVKILDINAEKKKIALGLKQVKPDPWEKFLQKYKVGDLISGRVMQVTDFGVFINLAPGIDGLIHVSELDKDYVSHPDVVTAVGNEVSAEIVEIDREKRRIRLSLRQLKKKKEKQKEEKEKIEKIDNLNLSEEDAIVMGDFIEEKVKEKLKKSFGKDK
ncbi:MAG: S1 RNA-binding domain-containing protein, partial [bacterium]